MMDGLLSADQIAAHSLDPRQFLDFRAGTTESGQRILHAHNSSGLTFSILPDRGFDLWTAEYRGLPITWIAPGSPYPPDMRAPWLSIFNGGLMTTCGLLHAGAADIDAAGKPRDLHGMFTRLGAGAVSVTRDPDGRTIRASATVYETQLFGVQLRLTRTYTLRLGEPSVAIDDVVENLGDHDSPLMLLYHINVGYPLVRAGARLHVTSDVYPRDAAAWSGAGSWAAYDGATPRYDEQVFFHHTRVGDDGLARVALINPDLAFVIAWRAAELPYLTQWKNTRQGIYVCGIEPGNCIPEGETAARAHGRLQTLRPGERQSFHVTIALTTPDDARAQIASTADAPRIDGAVWDGLTPLT